MDELPAPKQIQREAFNEEDFQVDEFLYQYHEYQSLEDLQKQLRKWKQILEQELIDVINQDYKQFVELGESLSGGESTVSDVKMELLSFTRQVSKVQQSLDANKTDIGQLLDEKKSLVTMQGRVKQVILFSKRLSDVERCVELDELNEVELGKKFVALVRMSHRLDGATPFVDKQLSRVDALRQRIATRLQRADRSKQPQVQLQRALLIQMVMDS